MHKKNKFILVIILFLSNITFVYGYWINSVICEETIIEQNINIGEWSDNIINDEEDLIEFLSGTGDTTADYQLTEDIDLSSNDENEFEPIDNFTGTFDGNGHTITGFSIVDDTSDYTGIFVTNSGTISNVIVEDVNISQSDNENTSNVNEVSYIGVLIGENQGTVENVQVTSSIITAENNSASTFFNSSSLDVFAGGIVGYNGINGVIKNSYSHADVYMETDITAGVLGTTSANTYAGGLVGYNEGEISQSYSIGNITNVVNNSSNRWSSSNANNYTGGLVGYNSSTGNVHHVFATGNIIITSNLKNYVGYVIGFNQGSSESLFRLDSQTYSPYNATLYNQATQSTISDLQSETFLTNHLDFDFVNIWKTQVNDYPILK